MKKTVHDVELFKDWVVGGKSLKDEKLETIQCMPLRGGESCTLRRTCDPDSQPSPFFEAWQQKRNTIVSKHIPPIVEAGTSAEGSIYVVERFGDGVSLSNLVHAAPGIRSERNRAVKAVHLAARALEVAAKQGIYHGDLHPKRDLMFARTRGKKLMVLGLGAIQAFGLENVPSRNEYAAPERKAGTRFDHRADIYSLGAILCKLATGQARGAEDTYTGQNGLRWEIEYLIALATKTDPADRFQTWDAFIEAAGRCLQVYKRPRSRSLAVMPLSAATSSKPSSSTPTPRPHAPALSTEAPSAPTNEVPLDVRRKGTKAIHLAPIHDPITLPSAASFTPPANENGRRWRRVLWVASSLGLAFGAAACFALFWFMRVPDLGPTRTWARDGVYNSPTVLWTMTTATVNRSVGREERQALMVAQSQTGSPKRDWCKVLFCVQGGEEPREPGR